MSEISNFIAEYSGYTNRLEVTNTPDPSFLVAGSQNALLDWQNSLSSRRGYTLLGAVGATGGVKGEFTWRTNRGDFYVGRQVGKTLQIKRTNAADEISWVTIHDSTGGDEFDEILATFETVFDDTLKIDRLVFAAGNVKFFTWTGATASIVATTATTIETNRDLGAAGFGATGDVVINGTTYSYTGITTDTFTGVTADPTGEADDSFIASPVTAQAIAGIPDNFTCDFIGVQRNQVYVSSRTSRIVLASNATDYTDFVTSTAVGGPRELTLDDNGAGFLSSKQSMIIFGQENSIFEIRKTISADNLKEYWEIERLATSPRQGLISPLAKIRVKNALIYITREKTLDMVEFVENISDEQTVPISDLVKNDFDSFDFTGASISYWERNIIVCIPTENLMYMYDLQRKIWQAPITWAGATIAMCSVDENGGLVGHDAFTNSSYLLFNGKSDNGEAIISRAVFAYNNYGDRFAIKRMTKYSQDGYISPNGLLKRTIQFDYRGGEGIQTSEFNGNENKFVYNNPDSGGFGKAPLGSRPLAGSSLLAVQDLKRFRYADSLPPQEFYEVAITYEMETLEGAWRLVAHGSDTNATNSKVNNITRL
jgi:hypothetical protein